MEEITYVMEDDYSLLSDKYLRLYFSKFHAWGKGLDIKLTDPKSRTTGLGELRITLSDGETIDDIKRA